MNSKRHEEEEENEGGLIGVDMGNYYLPQDIMEEHILIQLPIKSLLRVRAVNKSWNSLITSIAFKLKHYNHRRLKLGRQQHLMISSGAEIWNMDTTSSSSNNHHLHRLIRRSAATRATMDLSAGVMDLHNLSAISNGIVLLGGYLVWNPATRASVTLPYRRHHGIGDVLYYPGGSGVWLLGFWFDPISQEYMVIEGGLRGPASGSFELYSSRSGRWKSFPAANTRLVPKTRNRNNNNSNRRDSMDHGVVVHGWSERDVGYYGTRACIDGKCYWLANEKQSHGRRSEVPVVIVFDFEAHVKEEDHEYNNYCNVDVMAFPKTIHERLGEGDRGRTMNLIEYEGCLAFLTTYNNFVEDAKIINTRICDVWVMMGGGKDDHYGGIVWEQKYSIHFDPMFYGLGRIIGEPRALLKRMSNGELGFVFEVSDNYYYNNMLSPANVKLILYDPSTETYEDIEIAPLTPETQFDVIPYVESLFYIAPKKPGLLIDSETITCSKEDEQGIRSRRTQDNEDDEDQRRRKHGSKFTCVLQKNIISGYLKKLFSRCT